jgi:hypothetical protein
MGGQMSSATEQNNSQISPESISGLAAWKNADLPMPPMPKGFGWMGVVGPGVIVLGASIGSGEFLLGPAVFVKLGLSLFWVTTIAVFLQTVFNTELMRYTMATGEPAVTGFMRTRPSSTAWAWFYAILFFMQVGWPAWAGTAAGAVFFLFAQHLPEAADKDTIYLIGVGTFLVCVTILMFGRRIERTLEVLNWILVVCILGGFLIMAIILVPLGNWIGVAAGFVGFDTKIGQFNFLPEGADFFLLAALAGYSGAGGMVNIVLSNWARDKGYGMSKLVGYIPSAIGGHKVELASTGYTFTPDEESMKRWHGWWRIIRADQWGVFFVGALFGMMLPAVLYVSLVEPGSDIRGPGIGAVLAQGVGSAAGPYMAVVVALLAVWLLFKTQLDILEGMVRTVTDLLWTGSEHCRNWTGRDVRKLYYTVLGVVVIWGIIALRFAPPIMLLQISANMAGIVLIFSSLHLLYVNTRLLPVALRPSMWRRVVLVFTAIFYTFFTAMSLRALF